MNGERMKKMFFVLVVSPETWAQLLEKLKPESNLKLEEKTAAMLALVDLVKASSAETLTPYVL